MSVPNFTTTHVKPTDIAIRLESCSKLSCNEDACGAWLDNNIKQSNVIGIVETVEMVGEHGRTSTVDLYIGKNLRVFSHPVVHVVVHYDHGQYRKSIRFSQSINSVNINFLHIAGLPILF